MSWSPRQTDLIKKQLAELGKLLGGKPAKQQRPVVLLGRGRDPAQALCAQVVNTRQDLEGLAVGLSTAAYRQLKLDGQSQKEDRKAAVNAALGGVWHEERAHSALACRLMRSKPGVGAAAGSSASS
eukprot:4472357-Amphidinium_carterae.1